MKASAMRGAIDTAADAAAADEKAAVEVTAAAKL